MASFHMTRLPHGIKIYCSSFFFFNKNPEVHCERTRALPAGRGGPGRFLARLPLFPRFWGCKRCPMCYSSRVMSDCGATETRGTPKTPTWEETDFSSKLWEITTLSRTTHLLPARRRVPAASRQPGRAPVGTCPAGRPQTEPWQEIRRGRGGEPAAERESGRR